MCIRDRPYTPLHVLLFGEDIDCMVMTSANLSDVYKRQMTGNINMGSGRINGQMAGTDYTTIRPRGISLVSTSPGTLPNGCRAIVLSLIHILGVSRRGKQWSPAEAAAECTAWQRFGGGPTTSRTAHIRQRSECATNITCGAHGDPVPCRLSLIHIFQ